MTCQQRRGFLKTSAAVGFGAGTSALNMLGGSNAIANSSSDYKALVCVFLKGGLDHNDTILPYDTHSFDALAKTRSDLFKAYRVGSGNSTRDLARLLPLSASNIGDFGGRRFALPANMAALHPLFEDGELAVLGNVGPLISPSTRDAIERFQVEIPENLFSHNDQQSTWMSMGPEGTRQGWGGLMLDRITRQYQNQNSSFAAVSTSGNNVLLAGNVVQQFSVPLANNATPTILNLPNFLKNAKNSTVMDIMRSHLMSEGSQSPNLYVQDMARYNHRAISHLETYEQAMQSGISPNSAFPKTSLGEQLSSVAATIAVRQALGVSRQIFYVSLGGFDTHNGQTRTLPALQTEISDAIASFRSSMNQLGIWDDVTLFTAGDFGRTVTDNGTGSDHGWGGHHFIAGGSVKGGKLYGDLPEYDLGAQMYTRSRGRLIPTTSVEQYAATLGRWLGLSEADLKSVFPNLDNFTEPFLDFV